MHRTLIAGAVLSASLIFAAPASADLAGGYNDRQTYDLTFHASEANFEARLRLAARQICGQRMGRVPIREYLQIRECKRDFIAGARSTAS